MKKIIIQRFFGEDRLSVELSDSGCSVDVERMNGDGEWVINPEAGILIPADSLDDIIIALQKFRKAGFEQRVRGLIDQIRSFGQLPEDWDSYGASPISYESVQVALAFLDYLFIEYPEFPLPTVGPSPADEVVFMWHSPDYSEELQLSLGARECSLFCSKKAESRLTEQFHAEWIEARLVMVQKVVHYLTEWGMLIGSQK